MGTAASSWWAERHEILAIIMIPDPRGQEDQGEITIKPKRAIKPRKVAMPTKAKKSKKTMTKKAKKSK